MSFVWELKDYANFVAAKYVIKDFSFPTPTVTRAFWAHFCFVALALYNTLRLILILKNTKYLHQILIFTGADAATINKIVFQSKSSNWKV